MVSRRTALAIAALAIGSIASAGTPTPAARQATHAFPRLGAQLQLYTPPLATLATIATRDYVVIDAVMAVSPAYAAALGPSGTMRTINPNLVSVAYFSSSDIIPTSTNAFNVAFRNGLLPGWYMYDTSGGVFPLFWLPGFYTSMLNLTTPITSYMATFLDTNVIATGRYDGIFYDWVNGEISWLNYRTTPPNWTDVDNNGLPDADAFLDAQWTTGMSTLLTNSRTEFPPDTLVVGNGGWFEESTLDPLLNGFLLEQFLEGESLGPPFDWSSLMRSYRDHVTIGPAPDFTMIMANRDGPPVAEDLPDTDLAFMRYSLAATLMYDGYFTFTNRTNAYTATWWFDEYAVDFPSGVAVSSMAQKGWLGQPLGPAHAPANPGVTLSATLGTSGTTAATQPWRRDFTNGIVIVNPGPATTVALGGTFRRIAGNDDPLVNDGATVSGTISVGAQSGVLLLRPAPPTTTTTSTTSTSSTTMTTIPPLCAPAHRLDCSDAAAGRSALTVKQSSNDAQDRLTWNWVGAAPVAVGDFGSPTTTTDYAFCLYADAGLLVDSAVPAGGLCAGRPCWKSNALGFGYKQASLLPDGVLKLGLRAGAAERASVKLVGKGAALDVPALPWIGTVTAQLVRRDTGACWGATFSNSSANDSDLFKARSD